MTLLPAAAILVGQARRARCAARSTRIWRSPISAAPGCGSRCWCSPPRRDRRSRRRSPRPGSGAQTLVAIAALVGFGTKAGLIPLHSWLPRAHPVAPAHLSALMSGMMIKVALYGLIRVEFQWLGATPRWLGIALLAVGAAVLARRRAVGARAARPQAAAGLSLDRERRDHRARPRRLAAVRATPASATWAAIAFAAALLHIANHAIFKALLFLGAGAFERAVGQPRPRSARRAAAADAVDRRRVPDRLDGDRRAAAAERLRVGVADAAVAAARRASPAGRRRARRRRVALAGAGGDRGAGAAVLRQGRRARAARRAAAGRVRGGGRSARRDARRDGRRWPVLCVAARAGARAWCCRRSPASRPGARRGARAPRRAL